MSRSIKLIINMVILLALSVNQVAAAPNLRNTESTKRLNEADAFSSTNVNPNNVLPQTTNEPIQPEETIKISGENGGTNPTVSMDGRYIAYESNGEVILHDLLTASNTLIGTGESPYVSSTGIFVTFVQGNNIYVWDQIEEEQKFVAVGSSPKISADGRYIAFYNSNSIYVKDMESGSISLESVSPEGNGYAHPVFSLSADGNYLTFYNGNLTSDTSDDIFIRDLSAGTSVPLVTETTINNNNAWAWKPSISMDGKYVAFLSPNDLGSSPTTDNLFITDTHNSQTANFVPIYINGGLTLAALYDSPTISADGNFVAYRVSYSNQAYITDVQKGITTRVSISTNGTNGNGIDGIPQISANGKIVAFSSTSSNLVENDTNGQQEDVFVRGILQKPPLILVHGWQGLNPDEGFHCTGDPATDVFLFNRETNNSNLEPKNNLKGIAEMFEEIGFQVWIAHFETNKNITPSLEDNGLCLSNQIKYVANLSSSPITIVAHSTGGMVSRNAIRRVYQDVNIKALYTFGAPHEGIPSEILTSLLQSIYLFGIDGITITGFPQIKTDICKYQVAACQMSPTKMPQFNKENFNIKGIEYVFIGGDGGDETVTKLLKLFAATGIAAPNDGLSGTYSSVGWVHPNKEFSSAWTLPAPPLQYTTDETHPSTSSYAKAYYVEQAENGIGGHSDTFLCILAILQHENPTSDSENCKPAQDYQLPQVNLLGRNSVIQTLIDVVENETKSISVNVDSTGGADFLVFWSGDNAPEFTLTTPTGQVIDQVYTSLHPQEVTYEAIAGSSVSLPYIVYRVSSGQPGIWQLNISSTDTVAYLTYTITENSPRILDVSTDLNVYQVGDVATITAALESNGIGLAGATVTAKITRPDDLIDTLLLTDLNGDGNYTSVYTIPNTPGFLITEIVASGVDNGVAYTRQAGLIINVAPNNLQITGNNSDVLNDENADGFAETLDFNFIVTANTDGQYNISGDLYAGDILLAQAADYFALNSGTQNVLLHFDGSAIREMGLNGPYTIKNLYATPLDIGITDLYVENIHTTAAYSYTEFGRYPCYPLTVNHTGNGADPQFTPSNSKGCFTNEFVAGEFINLTATPSAGWSVGSWDGTIADASTSTTNIALMPANSHAITVNYINPNIPWSTTFLGGSGDDQGYAMVDDGAGNYYVMGISNNSWGNPIRAYSGQNDIFVAKVDATGNLVWNTFLGGSVGEYFATQLAIDTNGNVYVAVGSTDSTWGNPVRPYGGGTDAAVAKLSPTGELLWNTFLGGSEYDAIAGLVVNNGNVYVSGNSTGSWGNPVNAYVPQNINDGYVASLDANTGSLNWNTFFGGLGLDYPGKVSMGSDGALYVTGYSRASWGTPVRAYTPVSGLDQPDGFIGKFDAVTGSMLWNTFLGGDGLDIVYEVEESSTGSLYVLGRSSSTWDDPLNAYAGGTIDVFVSEVNSTTGTLLWNEFIGGSGADFAREFFVDASDNIHLTGASDATWGSPLNAHAGNNDAFYAKLDSAGGILVNTFAGGSGSDKSYGLGLGTGNDLYLAGYTDASWGTPVIPYAAGNDAFLAKINIEGVPVIASSVTRASTNPTNANSVNYTVTFSEAVTGVDAADFTLSTSGVTGASVTGVSGTGNTYTVAVNTGNGSGTIRLDITNNGTIAGSGSRVLSGAFSTGQSYNIDKTFPTVLSSVRDPMNSNTSGLNFTVTFSESVTGVDVADFTLTTTGVTGASVLSVTGSGSSYVVNVNPGSGSGTVRLNIIDNDSIIDTVSNRLGGTGTGNGSFTTGASYTVTSVTLSSLGTQDGQILESSENSNVGGTVNATATTIVVGDDATDKQYKSLMHFDTSTLPDTAIIASAIVQVRQQGTVTGTNPFTTHGNLVAAIQKPYFGTNNSLLTEDFQATPGMAGVATFSSTPTNSWYSSSMISGGFLYINLTGTTQIRISFTLDDNDDNGADYIAFASGNNGTTANRPKIVIQYYLP